MQNIIVMYIVGFCRIHFRVLDELYEY